MLIDKLHYIAVVTEVERGNLYLDFSSAEKEAGSQFRMKGLL